MTSETERLTWKCPCGHSLMGSPDCPPFMCDTRYFGGESECTCPQCVNLQQDTCPDCKRPLAGILNDAEHNTGECGCETSRSLCWRRWTADGKCCKRSPYDQQP